MSLSAFRRKELAAFVQDLARGEITAPPGDVVFLHQDLAKLLRAHEALVAAGVEVIKTRGEDLVPLIDLKDALAQAGAPQ